MNAYGYSLAMALTAAVCAGGDVGFVNMDFESGKEPWGVWYSDAHDYSGSRFAYGPDTATAHSGRASMRIVATSREGRAFVNQSTEQFTPGVKYELSYWVKFSSPDMAQTCAINVNLRKPRPDGKGLTMRTERPTVFSTPGEGGWTLRRGMITVDADTKLLQIGLYVRDSVGTAWFDGVRLRKWSEGDVAVTGLYDYYPLQVKLGRDMAKRFGKLADAESPFLVRAKVYNQTLVDVAHLQEDARRLKRCAHYARAASAGRGLAQTKEVVAGLAKLYETYGRLFLAKDEAGLGEFDRVAAQVREQLESARAAVRAGIAALQTAARADGQAWAAPAVSKPKPVVIAHDGRPNQIVLGTRSRTSHTELEAPLTISKIHNVPVIYGLSRFKDPKEPYKFSVAFDLWERVKAAGVEQACLSTGFAVHASQMTPRWFLDELKDDPDLLLAAADGAKLKPWRTYAPPLNPWRPEVRAMTVDLASQMARQFRPHRQFLCYVFANENLGPYFSVQRGVRSTGYNPSALPDFHGWLKDRYGSVGALNRQWHSDYARIEDTKPPEDLCLAGEWKRPHPLGYEFQSWREDRHYRWQKLIYDTLKKGDPTKPVFASHSRLLAALDGSRLFDAVDIMGFHSHPPLYQIGTTYIHSMNRYARKQLGQYECFWGCQEELPRIGEEKVQRAAMMKYLYRLVVWGRHVQVWWYSHTTADYLLRYNGNWFDPVYDLTTLRYCVAALPVGKAKVKRLEDMFLTSPIVPSRIAMVQPNTSMLFQQYSVRRSYLEMVELHNLLFPRNTLYELLPETFFTDGRAVLDDFDVVVLPYAPYFPDKLASLLRGWVKRGGVLIALGPFGLYDKFGFDGAALWTDVFGPGTPSRATDAKEREWRWALEGKGEVMEASLGRGKVIATLRSLRSPDFRDTAGPRLVAAIESRAPRVARCDSEDVEMTVHQSPSGERYLCAINRNVDLPVTADVSLAGAFAECTDLDVPDGFPVPSSVADGRTTLRLSLDPGEFTVIALGRPEHAPR